MIRHAKFLASRGTCVGTCKVCGRFAACKLTANRNCDVFLFCADCASNANVQDTGHSLRHVIHSLGGQYPPRVFH